MSADREGGEIHLWVRDNGMGMPPGLVQSAFGLFVQGDRALDRSSGGLGIGLTMVKNLVQLHGGTVEAHSAGLGRGSEFLVRLPAWDGDAAELDETAVGPRRETPRELFRVLIVDDSVDLAEGIAALLTDAGHDVRTAYDGPSGLDAAAGFRPEVVLLDVGLPGLTGYEVADRLREIPGVEEARIVAITGYGQESDKAEAKLHGFDAHVVKPVSFDKLQSVIAAPRRPAPKSL